MWGMGFFFFRVIVCSGEWMQASQEAGEPRRCFFFFFLHMSAQSFKNHTFTPFCLESTADCNAERDGARA